MYEHGSRELIYRAYIIKGTSRAGTLRVENPHAVFDSTAEVKGSFTCTAESSDAIDWYRDRLQLVKIENDVEESIGIYLPQAIPESISGSSKVINVTASDLGILAKLDCILERLDKKAGTLYLQVIEELLMSCGIKTVYADSCTDTLVTDRDDWDIGTSKLTIINQLLSEIGFNDLWFDASGSARLTRYQQPTASKIDHIYQTGKNANMEVGITVDSDLYSIPNIWVRTCANPDNNDVTWKSTYTNSNPLSRTSTVYRGYNKVDYGTVDSIASQAALDTYVQKLAFEAMQGYKTITFPSAIESGHGFQDTCAVRATDFDGICYETSWDMDFQSMVMSHTAKELVDF